MAKPEPHVPSVLRDWTQVVLRFQPQKKKGACDELIRLHGRVVQGSLRMILQDLGVLQPFERLPSSNRANIWG